MRLARTTWVGIALGALAMVGCESGPIETRDAGRGDGGSSSGGTTYYEHVRPILVENCVMCHVAGGVGPFPLTSYEAAVEVAESMREVTAARIMPPFLADNSGACNTWSNHRGLTDEEIATIDAWVRGGTFEGDPTTPAPTPVELPTLSSVDGTLEMAAEFTTDASIDDEYRCFIVDPGLTSDMFLTGYDVMPGNVQRVHHVIVYNPVDDAAAAAAVARDASEGEATDGYTCYGGAGVDAAPVVLWAPGAGATRFPRGTGIELTAGRPLVMQIHYNNLVASDVPATDRTRVQLSLAATANPAYLPLMGDFNLELPPRTEEVSESATMSFDRLPVPSVRVWGVFPHMHTLGRTLRVDINRPDTNQCLIDVPRWDFHWQMAYWLDDPIEVTPEDAATITCTFDTRERDSITRFGEGTEDEMCLAFVYVTL
jgi:hypothetical protein